MTDVLLKTTNVTKEFGSGESIVHAIRGISVVIEKGEFIAILGKSGSGKTTFISLLGGLLSPSSGEVLLDGVAINTLSQDKLSLIRREKVGIVFQHFHLLEMMTAVENVELPLLIAGAPSKARREKAIAMLQKVGLGDRLANYPNELSGGERQRVGIARALVTSPELILADEPTGDLDSKTGDEIIDVLVEVNTDSPWHPTIIMVTHDVTKLRKGMRILTLSDGHITGDVIFDGVNVEQFDKYGVPSEVLQMD